MKLPNYTTTEPNAIIARMFKNNFGDWLKKCKRWIYFFAMSMDCPAKTKNATRGVQLWARRDSNTIPLVGALNQNKKRREGRSFVSAERFEYTPNGLKESLEWDFLSYFESNLYLYVFSVLFFLYFGDFLGSKLHLVRSVLHLLTWLAYFWHT